MSQSRLSTSVLSVLFLLGALSATRADQVVIEPSKDNTLYEDIFGESSNGSGPHIFSGKTNNAAIRRAILAFNVAGAVPAGSTVTSVTLRMTVSRTTAGPQNTELRRLTQDWGESDSDAGESGGGGSGAGIGDATWLHRFYSTVFWTNPGGDYSGTSSASVSVAGTGTSPVWGSTAQMVSDVQGWLDSPASNFGWLVLGNEAANHTAKRFHAREGANANQRPKLTLNYTPPPATGACCQGGGACSILSSSQCATAGGTYQGDGTTCSPTNPCSGPTGACCDSNGSCTVDSESACDGSGGTYSGNGTNCTPNQCPQPQGACCFPNGTCDLRTLDNCSGNFGSWNGANTSCAAAECEVQLTPFVDALPIPAVATPLTGFAGGAAHYRIEMTEFAQTLHRDLPATRVWGYGNSYPGPTIEAAVDQQVTVEWANQLRDGLGNLRSDHLLDVDLCPHGPDMAGPSARTVVHMHGAHVPEAFDGYPELTFLPGSSSSYVYPNHQVPGTLWYHDHALGITRLNVYLGLAGFYLLRDATEQSLGLPSGSYEIPLVIQDRKFNADGSFYYPPALEEHFFGDKLLVNGKVWPFLNVAQGKYRFRVLNGSGSRHYRLALSNAATFQVIGTEGGLLPAPTPVNQLLLGPGERADVVINFASYAPGTEIVLTNDAPAPYPGPPGAGVIPNVMKFIVQAQTGHTAAIPATLRPIEVLDENDATVFRNFELQKFSDACAGSRWLVNGLVWDDVIEYPELGETEVWSFINRSGMAHPMHMHLVSFQILDRQNFTIVSGQVTPIGSPVPPPAHEAGWKDTVLVEPFVITRVIARFEDYKGRFAYHCHILEHEDHEMMRQFQTVQCGDSEIDPTESCDDGNLVGRDACSTGCDAEHFVAFVGPAQGGTVQVTIDGVVVQITTLPGQTAAQVAQALADAINAAPGVVATATREGDRVIIDTAITQFSIADAGLSDLLTLRVSRNGLWWADVENASSYDVVRGVLKSLHVTDGDFSQATMACLTNNLTGTQIAASMTPEADEGFWFLVREVTSGGNGSYDSGGAGQVAGRDAGIAASGNACP